MRRSQNLREQGISEPKSVNSTFRAQPYGFMGRDFADFRG